ncbi:phage protein NinX family protein [Ewingella sp. CoE-038-23]|uniref:phage protein NinX family protein n=1 Tax=Ewingella docleensis TaxID=3118588 RepID=UPI0033654112
MKDYSAMSDYLINQHVAESLPGKYLYYADYIWDTEEEKKFEPTSSWADAGPIIAEQGISLLMYRRGKRKAYPASQGMLSPCEYQDENPLRSAMICYLIMKDAEKGHG